MSLYCISTTTHLAEPVKVCVRRLGRIALVPVLARLKIAILRLHRGENFERLHLQDESDPT